MMLIRDQFMREMELRHLRDRQLLAALPKIETIQVDPTLPTAPDLGGLCFAFWEGYERRELPALLAIALDPAALPRERWLTHRPAELPRLGSVLGAALSLTDERLALRAGKTGRSKEVSQYLMAQVRPFGIHRGGEDGRSYGRDRGLSLSAMQTRVAEALARCLVQLFDPNPATADPIPCAFYPLGCAENPRGSRTSAGYSPAHGNTLRFAA
jgi:hypothetical protein